MIRRPPRSTLFLHDALPISLVLTPALDSSLLRSSSPFLVVQRHACVRPPLPFAPEPTTTLPRSEEHTSELQSQSNLVCRLLLEKKKKLDLPSVHSACRLAQC